MVHHYWRDGGQLLEWYVRDTGMTRDLQSHRSTCMCVCVCAFCVCVICMKYLFTYMYMTHVAQFYTCTYYNRWVKPRQNTLASISTVDLHGVLFANLHLKFEILRLTNSKEWQVSRNYSRTALTTEYHCLILMQVQTEVHCLTATATKL